VPEFRHYNPIGTVHGGFAATLLDSALACSIFTTMVKGDSWTTLELKLNFVRALTKDTGPVRAEGRIIHHGRDLGRRPQGSRGQALRPRHHDLHDFSGASMIPKSGNRFSDQIMPMKNFNC
jgi:hypothetical protein